MPDFGGPSMAEDQHAERLNAAIERERVRREARRFVDAEEVPRDPLPPFPTLRERLAQPAPASVMRIDGWQPIQSRAVLAAQFKAGKTTVRDNLIRSLVDGDPFLGRDRVTALTGTLALIDLEMSEYQMDRWHRDQGIYHDDRVHVAALRGRAASFNLLDLDIRREWAARFRAVQTEYLVLDCLRPVLDAIGLKESDEAGRFLVALDATLADAGISEALIVQHMGHGNERSRGDSRLRDWPDVEWRLMRRDENPASERYLTAYGRDVDIPESLLTYNPVTRHLTLAGGNRRDAAGRDALAAVVALLSDGEARSGRQIKTALEDSEYPRDAIDQALHMGVRDGVLVKRDGPRNSKLYRSVSECPAVSGECPADSRVECPAAYIEPDTRTLTAGRENTNGAGHSTPFDAALAFMRPERGAQ